MKQFSDWSKAVGQLDASLVDCPSNAVGPVRPGARSATSVIRPRCNYRSFGFGLPSSMNLPGLSDFERRILKRSAELGVAPYEDTPRKRRDASLPQSASTAAEDSSPATPPPEPPRRVGGTNWCDCGRCTTMPTNRECFCCRELPQAVRKQPAECITVNTDFFKLCLDVAVLAVAYCEVREKGLEHSHELHE
ncbi:unnamed protein product [Ixodes pacificus]